MKDFNFYSDEKVTVWERNRFTVKAETLEEAICIVVITGTNQYQIWNVKMNVSCSTNAKLCLIRKTLPE